MSRARGFWIQLGGHVKLAQTLAVDQLLRVISPVETGGAHRQNETIRIEEIENHFCMGKSENSPPERWGKAL